MKMILNNSEYIDKEETKFFTASVVHDLKTPINAQIKILEMLLDGKFGHFNSNQKKIISEIYNSSKYTYNLVLNILDICLYRQNKLTLRRGNFYWNTFLKELLWEFSSLIQEKSQHLTVKSNCTDAIICLDKFQMKRVIINLLSNANSYSPNNSQINIYSNVKNGFLEFKISNQSSFPLTEKIDCIFNIFKTKSIELSYQNSSRIGLYVVKQIVEAHKGKVYAKISKDNLCTLGFKIPVK